MRYEQTVYNHMSTNQLADYWGISARTLERWRSTCARHHFQVPLKRGVDLVDEARRRLDGYAKRFRFILGHDIGKIEICGRTDDKLILKQIHAREGEEEQAARMMIRKLNDTGGWLEDFEESTL